MVSTVISGGYKQLVSFFSTTQVRTLYLKLKKKLRQVTKLFLLIKLSPDPKFVLLQYETAPATQY